MNNAEVNVPSVKRLAESGASLGLLLPLMAFPKSCLLSTPLAVWATARLPSYQHWVWGVRQVWCLNSCGRGCEWQAEGGEPGFFNRHFPGEGSGQPPALPVPWAGPSGPP